MHFTREQRDSWAAETRNSAFNKWMRERVSDRTGRLNLSALHRLAAEFGIDASIYSHLNPGQQRMNVGNRLRKLVPAEVYKDCVPRLATKWPAKASSGPRAAAATERSPAFNGVTDRHLMQLYGSVIDELRARGVIRTANAPLGDYAEHLFAKALGWSLQTNSAAGHDATDVYGTRFQIKARRLRTNSPGERQLSVIRALPEAKFDVLAAVLFDSSFHVQRAALVPHSIVLTRSTYVSHVNGWRMILDDSVWMEPGVEDVTSLLAPPLVAQRAAEGLAAREESASKLVRRALDWFRSRI